MAGGFLAPTSYALLPGKTEVLYTNLSEELDTLGLLTPDSVLLEYKQALQNAVLTVWPGTTLRGCYFHYKQALWRKLAKSYLVLEYKVAGSDVRKSFLIIWALLFLPNGDVGMTWRLRCPTLNPSSSDVFLCRLHGLHLDWDATLLGLSRSSNIAEGWHNGFKSLVDCSHPTIWKFLEALKLEQAITDMKFCNHLIRIEKSPSSKAEEMGPTRCSPAGCVLSIVIMVCHWI